jgi:hypothetical protein
MPRIAGLVPLTKADEADKEHAIVDAGFHSEGEEEFASRPPTEQIKRRLSGVEHPQAKQTPAWITLTVRVSSINPHRGPEPTSNPHFTRYRRRWQRADG